ncbi:MAG: phosphomethylpyrimidine synthase ThiC [Candidatus Omnitrophica bacterium]|nr:phosphomethylpyrimidine synthase ThiC [Candidatus Omnitrophota bacterium]
MIQELLSKDGTSQLILSKIAELEGASIAELAKTISEGKTVIPYNSTRRLSKPCGIGEGLRTKINANIGTSSDEPDFTKEIAKLDVAIEYGADAVMDLSTGPNIKKIREELLARCRVPFGTVPIYEACAETFKRGRSVTEMEEDLILDVIEAQASEGVDFFTIHAGVTLKAVEIMQREGRLLDIVSRGGAILARWMLANRKENPLYSRFNEVLDIAKKFNVTISLGDGMRPGSIADATDGAQIQELITLGELVLEARKKDVQVIVEGPGHVPLNEVKLNVQLEKSICHGAPFYVLGPLVTDIAAGYDHISGAIGGAIAAAAGADFLCYLTPSEHLRLPDVNDVKEGVIASRIAAHAGDIAKGIRGAVERDKELSRARRRRDWAKQIKLCIDPKKAKEYRESASPNIKDVCTMCSEYCSIMMNDECFSKKGGKV